MKFIILLLLNTNLHAKTLKFQYKDHVKLIKNLTEDDIFYKCKTRLYEIIEYTRNPNAYLLNSIGSDGKCDKNQPENNLIKIVK